MNDLVISIWYFLILFFILLVHYQIFKLSNYLIITLSNYQIITLSHYQIITLSNYHIIKLSHYHIITSPFYTVSINPFSTLLKITVPIASRIRIITLLYTNIIGWNSPTPIHAYLNPSKIPVSGLYLA